MMKKIDDLILDLITKSVEAGKDFVYAAPFPDKVECLTASQQSMQTAQKAAAALRAEIVAVIGERDEQEA